MELVVENKKKERFKVVFIDRYGVLMYNIKTGVFVAEKGHEFIKEYKKYINKE